MLMLGNDIVRETLIIAGPDLIKIMSSRWLKIIKSNYKYLL